MKTTLVTLLITGMLICVKTFSQTPPQGNTPPVNTFDYQLTPQDLTDDPVATLSYPEMIRNLYAEEKWTVGEGIEGPRREQYMADYENVKSLLPGEPSSPYFRLTLEKYCLEGQLFTHHPTGLYALIRGFDCTYYAIPQDFLCTLYLPQYLCHGLPSSNYEDSKCNNGALYRMVEFTSIGCDGTPSSEELILLYYDKEKYSGCIDIGEAIGICPFGTIVQVAPKKDNL